MERTGAEKPDAVLRYPLVSHVNRWPSPETRKAQHGASNM